MSRGKGMERDGEEKVRKDGGREGLSMKEEGKEEGRGTIKYTIVVRSG